MSEQVAGPSSMDVDSVSQLVSVEAALAVEEEGNGESASDTDETPKIRRHYASYSVGFVYDPRMMLHSCTTGHQEDPQRIDRIYNMLKTSGCIEQMLPLACREVRQEEALLVHSEALWEKVMYIGGRFGNIL